MGIPSPTICVNKLMGFLNDPRNFVNPDGTANFLKQIQAHSSVQLIFADVNALNYSICAHNRISYAMSALDKLANLRANLGEETRRCKSLPHSRKEIIFRR
jgi:hypothetical protein